MEFYDPDEGSFSTFFFLVLKLAEAEGLIHREPVREESPNEFEDSQETEDCPSVEEVCSNLIFKTPIELKVYCCY